MGEGLDLVEPRRDRERAKSQESRLEKGHARHPSIFFNLHTLALSLSRIHSVQTVHRPVPECQFPERGGSLKEVRTCIKVQKNAHIHGCWRVGPKPLKAHCKQVPGALLSGPLRESLQTKTFDNSKKRSCPYPDWTPKARTPPGCAIFDA